MAEPLADLPDLFCLAIEPGRYVRNPKQPGWGIGQVQSCIGARVTVNFAHAGKVLVNTTVVTLIEADPSEFEPRQ
jgi:hypothetical protein